MSAPKNSTAAEAAAIMSVSCIQRRSILSVPFFVPSASSSAARRVTAVHIPDEAKVDASIYTLKIS